MLEILSLIENKTGSDDLHAEHGLSLLVKQDDKNYLIDTGATSKFIENAEKMGVDLKRLDGIIISHNHSDHIGGLPVLLEYNSNVKIYIKNRAKSEFYYKVAMFRKYIGEEKCLFEKHKNRFIFFDDEIAISSGFRLLSNTMDDKYFFCRDNNLLEKKNGEFIPDNFDHETFAVFEEKEGLVIVSSCSHNGIVNIINTVKQKYHDKPILHVIGGFHMMGFGLKSLNCSKDYVREVANILNESCDKTVYTCHCTGEAAFNIMQKNIGDKISYLKTGDKIAIE